MRGCMNCGNISCGNNKKRDCAGCGRWISPEDKIAELERENAELKEELKTAYRKGMRHMAKALKDYDRTDGAWTDYFEHTVDKVLQREQLDFEENGTLADQITKAKGLLKQWLLTSKASGCDNINIVTDTEQFLEEIKEK